MKGTQKATERLLERHRSSASIAYQHQLEDAATVTLLNMQSFSRIHKELQRIIIIIRHSCILKYCTDDEMGCKSVEIC